MSTLKNGATELGRLGDVVLACWERHGTTEYITWRIGPDGATYQGEYFSAAINCTDESHALSAAAASLVARSGAEPTECYLVGTEYMVRKPGPAFEFGRFNREAI